MARKLTKEQRAGVHMEIINARSLFKKLEKTPKSINKAMGGVVSRAIIAVERQAKLNVTQTGSRHPQVQTGRLRASITHTVGMEGKMVVGKAGTNVKYAPYLEFGTEQRKAYPWLYPALRSVQTWIMANTKKEVRQAILNTWKKGI